MSRFFIKSKKPYFWAFLGPNWRKKIYLEKNLLSQLARFNSTLLYKKSGKLMAQMGPKNFFSKKNFFHNLAHLNSTALYKKSGKTNEKIFHKVQKTLLFGIFCLLYTSDAADE